jgi:hypothetical protein
VLVNLSGRGDKDVTEVLRVTGASARASAGGANVSEGGPTAG